MNLIHLTVSLIRRARSSPSHSLLGLRTWRAHVDNVTGLEYIDQSMCVSMLVASSSDTRSPIFCSSSNTDFFVARLDHTSLESARTFHRNVWTDYSMESLRSSDVSTSVGADGRADRSEKSIEESLRHRGDE